MVAIISSVGEEDEGCGYLIDVREKRNKSIWKKEQYETQIGRGEEGQLNHTRKLNITKTETCRRWVQILKLSTMATGLTYVMNAIMCD
ncbi:hypothetical protein DERF_013026 [Dermatophagoides farinae]|uniref:Uncharacterized protein n=1 Tax=Dermatophagoides farinae TaxID=6954 RepID=A0A922KY17_DERFA|nr:hypothetical protein DERF_013026 [Dermatophagoides farinae]